MSMKLKEVLVVLGIQVSKLLSKIKKLNLFNVSVITLVILLATLFLHIMDEMKNSKIKQSVQSLTEEVNIQKGKNGELIARITQLQGENSRVLTDLNSSREDVVQLQKYVNLYKNKIKNNGSVTVASNSIEVQGQMLKSSDTLSFKDKWTDLTVNTSTPSFDLKVKSNPILTIGEEEGVPFAEFRDENPHSTTKYLRSYGQKKKIGIFDRLDYGVGYSVLIDNTGLHHGPSFNVIYSLK